CFFFQAEDGIRDRNVTGVQTCALPIYQFLLKLQDFYIIGGLLQGETDTNLEVSGEIDHIDAVENNQLYETFTEVFQEVNHSPKKIGRASCREKVYKTRVGGM